MHVIAFIESRHATAHALQGARRDDPVRPAPPTKRHDPPTRRRAATCSGSCRLARVDPLA